MNNNFVRWTLERLRDGWGQERLSLERLLGPIEQELREICASVEAMKPPPDDADDNQHWGYESFIEEKCEDIEGLLAVAFVVAQTHVTQVVSRTMRVLDAAVRAGKPLSSFASTKADIATKCSAPVAGTQYTQIQVIDAFANYFKHNEEWVGPWANLPENRGGKTAKVLLAMEASETSTGNFRTGAEKLGNDGYKDVGTLVSIITSWRTQLATELATAAEAAGLM